METIVSLIVIVLSIRGTVIILRGNEGTIGTGLRVAIGVSQIITMLALFS